MSEDVVKVVSLTHRQFYPQEMPLVHISFRGCLEPTTAVRSDVLRQWIISLTQCGIEPATFLFVAQHLKHCAAAFPHLRSYGHRNWQIMKHACDLVLGINRTHIQPVLCKSPSTNVASIGDDDLTDKLIEQVILTSLYILKRNTQTEIVDTALQA